MRRAQSVYNVYVVVIVVVVLVVIVGERQTMRE